MIIYWSDENFSFIRICKSQLSLKFHALLAVWYKNSRVNAIETVDYFYNIQLYCFHIYSAFG